MPSGYPYYYKRIIILSSRLQVAEIFGCWHIQCHFLATRTAHIFSSKMNEKKILAFFPQYKSLIYSQVASAASIFSSYFHSILFFKRKRCLKTFHLNCLLIYWWDGLKCFVRIYLREKKYPKTFFLFQPWKIWCSAFIFGCFPYQKSMQFSTTPRPQTFSQQNLKKPLANFHIISTSASNRLVDIINSLSFSQIRNMPCHFLTQFFHRISAWIPKSIFNRSQ